MLRLTSRTAALLVAIACLAMPMALAAPSPCQAGAMPSCAHCKRSKAPPTRALAAPSPRCCLIKTAGQPQAPSLTERAQAQLELAPPPARRRFVVEVRALSQALCEPGAVPPLVRQRTHPLLC